MHLKVIFRHMTTKFRALLSMLSIWVGSSMVEQRPFKPLAVGSSPTRPTIFFPLFPNFFAFFRNELRTATILRFSGK